MLQHLKNLGALTPKQALQLYGSFRLASHIDVLRKAGYDIHTEMVTDNEGREFARYHLRG